MSLNKLCLKVRDKVQILWSKIPEAKESTPWLQVPSNVANYCCDRAKSVRQNTSQLRTFSDRFRLRICSAPAWYVLVHLQDRTRAEFPGLFCWFPLVLRFPQKMVATWTVRMFAVPHVLSDHESMQNHHAVRVGLAAFQRVIKNFLYPWQKISPRNLANHTPYAPCISL